MIPLRIPGKNLRVAVICYNKEIDMKCYLCNENMKDRGANRKKVDGVWIHKLCPVEAARRKTKKKEKQNGKKDNTIHSK